MKPKHLLLFCSLIFISSCCSTKCLFKEKNTKASGKVVLLADGNNYGIIKLEGRDHEFGSFLYQKEDELKLNQIVSFKIKGNNKLSFAYDIKEIDSNQIISLTDDIINLSCINWHNRLKHPSENKHIKGHIYPRVIEGFELTKGIDTYKMVEFSFYNNDVISSQKDSVYLINTFNALVCNETVYVHFQEENHIDGKKIIQQISCSEKGLH